MATDDAMDASEDKGVDLDIDDSWLEDLGCLAANPERLKKSLEREKSKHDLKKYLKE